MKTTVEIPDTVYPAIVAASAACGESVEDFIAHAAANRAGRTAELNGGSALTNSGREAGDRPLTLRERLEPVFGSADHESTEAVQRVIDEEFSKIDPKDWE